MIWMMAESFFATGLMAVFGVLWLRALRARDAAEAERDRIWDQFHGVGLFAAVLAVAALLNPVPAAATDVYRVYVSTTGIDSATGSADQPVRTLARAQQIVRAANPATDVEILIEPGTYTAGQTTWTYYNGHTITIRPASGTVVFDGAGSSGWWLVASLPSGSTGQTTRLVVQGMTVQRYGHGAIQFIGGAKTVNGLRRAATSGLNGTTVTGMTFKSLGSKWASGVGYGAVDLVNSRNNKISGNVFSHLENVGADASLIHGIYAADQSSGNVISGNSFSYITGGPLRARNDSNNLNIYGNRFVRSGTASGAGKGAYSDWFNTTSECASHGNQFHSNDVGTLYNGAASPVYVLSPSSQTYAGPSGCSNAGQARVTAWSNS